jgi:hypothetical protein
MFVIQSLLKQRNVQLCLFLASLLTAYFADRREGQKETATEDQRKVFG